MIQAIQLPMLSSALSQLKKIIAQNESEGVQSIVFCEDRLKLAAERAICNEVGGTFLTSVCSFSRYLSTHYKRNKKILSKQGSAMVIRRLMEDHRGELTAFKRLTSAESAQTIYDNIALLYASSVGYEELEQLTCPHPLLQNKVQDLALLYRLYFTYLKEHDLMDRNSYLHLLPSVMQADQKLKKSHVLFLGFQSFTSATGACVRAAMQCAPHVVGLFVSGEEEIYTREGIRTFLTLAKEFGGCDLIIPPTEQNSDADWLRTCLYQPECLNTVNPKESHNVHLYLAKEEMDEIEQVAVRIRKLVAEGERYAKISVMLPDIDSRLYHIERIFTQFGIPYYIDRKRTLAEHPICNYIIDYLNCVTSNCALEPVLAVLSSPLFPALPEHKDIFRNYLLQLASYRGGVKRPINAERCKSFDFPSAVLEEVQSTFLRGLGILSIDTPSEQVQTLLAEQEIDKKLEDMAKRMEQTAPAESAFLRRVYESVCSVLKEADSLTKEFQVPLKEYIKIIKSGFAALELSTIPTSIDRVFVSDLLNTFNVGSHVVFAMGLHHGVPQTNNDTAILTDRDLLVLGELNVKISPKIQDVNCRMREQACLNLCAFTKQLYLSYAQQEQGEVKEASDILNYTKQAFCRDGKPLTFEKRADLQADEQLAPYFCVEKIPAVKQLLHSEYASTILQLLYEQGEEVLVQSALQKPMKKQDIQEGNALYCSNRVLSPTLLENYFSCPYRAFMMRGLRLSERIEGEMHANDAGNFIHAVLQNISQYLGEEQTIFMDLVEKEIATQLQAPAYRGLEDSKRGQYVAASLKADALIVCNAAWEQMQMSSFIFHAAECDSMVLLDDGLVLGGRIDRVDYCGDYVRVIDYKSGTIDDSSKSYYYGLKLQLPLYLQSAAKDKQGIGAYYFPAKATFLDEESQDATMFRMKGFMVDDKQVMTASDVTMTYSNKSLFLPSLGREPLDYEEFHHFIHYGKLLARRGAKELLQGNITPSPIHEACKYCKLGGACGFNASEMEERPMKNGITKKTICNIAKRIEEGANE